MVDLIVRGRQAARGLRRECALDQRGYQSPERCCECVERSLVGPLVGVVGRGDIDIRGGVEARSSRRRAGYVADVLCETSAEMRMPLGPRTLGTAVRCGTSSKPSVIWGCARRCGLRVGMSPSGVEPLCVSVGRKWHSVGGLWRFAARRVQCMSKNRATLPLVFLGETAQEARGCFGSGKCHRRCLVCRFSMTITSDTSLDGRRWPKATQRVSQFLLWEGGPAVCLDMCEHMEPMGEPQNSGMLSGASERDLFVLVESPWQARAYDRRNLGSMMCLEVLSRRLSLVVDATTEGPDGGRLEFGAALRRASDIVPSELRTAFSRRMEREDHGPETRKGSTRNSTPAGAATDGDVSVVVRAGSLLKKSLGKGAKGGGCKGTGAPAAES